MLLGALVATVALVFGLIQRALSIDSAAALARAIPYAVTNHPGRDAIEFSFGPFLAVLVGSMGLAALRHRVAAFSIFVLVAITPLVQSALGVLPADRSVFSRIAPNPLGAFWGPLNARPQLGQLWRATAIDYGLALLPAIAIAAWTMQAGARASWHVRRPTRAEVAGLGCSAFLFWLVLHTWELRQTLGGNGASPTNTDLVAFLPFFLLGAVLARDGRGRFVPLAGVPILWSTAWIPTLLAGGALAGPTGNDLHEALPYLAVVATGALWAPIASFIDGERARGWVLVVALNALNVADVLFTRAAVHSGLAVEANPFASWIGPGLKLAGVGVASALVARYRPRALVWLVVVFGALIAWHLSGLVLDAP